MSIDRRDFLRRASLAGGAMLYAPSLQGLAAFHDARSRDERSIPGYGPLAVSSTVPELMIPAGFSVVRLSETRAPSQANPSFIVPQALDGMAAFPLPNGNVRLVRNHEIGDSATTAVPIGRLDRTYDRTCGGGTTSLEVRLLPGGGVRLEREFTSLSGTLVNCAGGPTPWGSWISCEETTQGKARGREKEHGYCFEVPASATEEVEPVPLKAMGRFVHEAIAVDPTTGMVYLTEDAYYNVDPARNLPGAGFYRFTPDEPGRLRAGGKLQMLAVRDAPDYLTVTGQTQGAPLPVAWVDIEDPDPAEAEADLLAVFRQGRSRGAAIFARLEGCWYGDGGIYFDATSGGDRGAGQVWHYRPDREELRLVFESPSREVLDGPDNICVSPRGGIVICEDGADVQFLRGLTPIGEIFDLVRTTAASSEFCGSCFSPDGSVLFFNRQGSTSGQSTAHGATYALWGPWTRGPL